MNRVPLTVLMATCNGASYLPEQLASIAAQTSLPTHLVISDDGSDDSTIEIVQQFSGNAPFPITLLHGPGKGPALNMVSLQLQAPSGYVAFADQDDFWLPQKLARAVWHLQKSPSHVPALYAARRIITDEKLTPVTVSAPLRRRAGFANALVQNIAPGNTIVLNPAAVSLARTAAQRVQHADLPFHDWWLYQLVSGAGGRIIFDATPVLLYRQHSANHFGSGHGLTARLSRLRALSDGRYKHWLYAQASALKHSADLMTPIANRLLENFLSGLDGAAAPVHKLGLYRQSLWEQVMLRLAMATGHV